MTTPVDRPDRPTAVPAPYIAPQPPRPRPDQARDFGWIITVVGASGALLASWTLFGSDSTDGMWAGYWTSFFCTIGILGAAWMRSTLPAIPGAMITGLTGLGLILVGALHDYATVIELPMVAGGAAITLGAVLQAHSRR